ncbi:DNA-binding GntR family transcriptional regulator [Actinoplanes campanulatus]|uniref:DNA-binding GntR family transcriptional regulator n=1 Tax=Actinoplanes campanulatus TaxID=113559 RepID=A0A7W5AST0_9ACTN|nr:hypothetical protein [Actinoplanes campanulatus]MBB3101610.1 DNA-binding GntR family transcriptional regulator [Actinoplanes campanulatus]
MQSEAADDRRSLSAAIFGNRAAADVIRAIVDLTQAGNQGVTTRMVARHAGLGDSIVRPVMLRLQSAGTLATQPRDHGSRSALHYEVQPGDLWDALRRVTEALPG